jgi:hypothetical protein
VTNRTKRGGFDSYWIDKESPAGLWRLVFIPVNIRGNDISHNELEQKHGETMLHRSGSRE